MNKICNGLVINRHAAVDTVRWQAEVRHDEIPVSLLIPMFSPLTNL